MRRCVSLFLLGFVALSLVGCGGPPPVGFTLTSISAGAYHSLGVESNGTVWAWGLTGVGDKNYAVEASGLSDVMTIAAGSAHSLAIKSDGTVWAWGANGYGQLGDGTDFTRLSPIQIAD